MTAKEILSSYLDRELFTEGGNLSDVDILKAMDEYHQAKSKEEAEERYKEAKKKPYYLNHYRARYYTDGHLRLAAFGRGGEG